MLLRGDAVYVSGQAAAGDSLASATAATLEQLGETLAFMKLQTRDVVRVKCFLQPMEQSTAVAQAVRAYFGDPAPKVSLVEWRGNKTRPIEIELIAHAPATNTEATVSYHTPPALTSSAVFSRVARIHGDQRIYVSGITLTPTGPVHSVDAMFQELIGTLRLAKTNVRHLAKATYYVAEASVSGDAQPPTDAGRQLNARRPHFYDPSRPPAASKATVAGVESLAASAGTGALTMDIVAAPEAPLHSVLAPLAEQLEPDEKVAYKTVKMSDGKLRPLHLHIFHPPDAPRNGRLPVMLAIHGGGWTGGNAQGFYPLAQHFSRQGMLGVSLEYRLRRANGPTVFDCVRDARSAVRYLRRHADALKIDPDRIVAMGGSAGGHLALSTALFNEVNDPQDDTTVSPTPNALLLWYPVIDTSAKGYGQNKIGDRWKELSPVDRVRAKMPPTLIFHGTGDAVTPYPGAKKFFDASQQLGNQIQLITHPGGRHGYIIFAPQEFRTAIEEMERFLQPLMR